MGKCGSVIDAIADHRHNLAFALEPSYNIHLVLGQDLAKNGKMVDRLEDLEAQEINEVIVLPLQETYLDRPGPPSLIVATATLRDDNLWTQAIAGASL